MSPYRLLQEEQLNKPHMVWRILVVSQMLHMSYTRKVRGILPSIWTKFPTPHSMVLNAAEGNLLGMVAPLGGAMSRYLNLRTMSRQYCEMHRADPEFWKGFENGDWCVNLTGCGVYVRDSLNVVVYGQLDAPTIDHRLEKYRMWRLERRDLIRRGLATTTE